MIMCPGLKLGVVVLSNSTFGGGCGNKIVSLIEGRLEQVISDAPLSITTSPSNPYGDTFGPDNLLRYRYQGTDPNYKDNRYVRFAMERRLPLVYFHGFARSKYLATWPVFIVGDNPSALVFTVAADDITHLGIWPDKKPENHGVRDDIESARRAYITASVRVRLHQRAFREKVLEAYRRQCAFCRLRHEELLDAAHIVPDVEPEGEPLVKNGMSLCALHHAAFDRFFIGVTPDFKIEVRIDVLREKDGPTLAHAIQALHGSRIYLPKRIEQQPARELLEIRYQRFRQASF